ncbi:MAG: universal stress protein [Gemmatales bacterium]|nr:universal stress protein [Gemmatales bacterium]MDW8386004.1 universal stress protein [Gemmatales bacterium]
MLALKTILHATDFSPHSEYAFRLACSLARDHGAKVVVLHVVAPHPAVSYGEMIVEPDAALVQQAWDQIRTIKSPDPAVPLEHRVEQGFAAAEIVRVAEEIKADMIVLGTHGRSGLGRLLMGSVAEQVVRKAPCPVLTVKSPVRLVETNPAPEPSVYSLQEGH